MNILGIKNAKYIEDTNTIIDLVLETDEGDMPFGFHPDDDAPATEYVRSKLGTFPVAPYIPPVIPFETLQAEKIAYIQTMSNNAISTLTAGYTIGEKESFAQQKKGAEDIILDTYVDTVEASYVRQLADIRVANGDSILGALEGAERYAAFAQRILANAQEAEQATLAIIGKQQGLEVRARLATTPEQLENIVW
jgi:hypothetical protein